MSPPRIVFAPSFVPRASHPRSNGKGRERYFNSLLEDPALAEAGPATDRGRTADVGLAIDTAPPWPARHGQVESYSNLNAHGLRISHLSRFRHDGPAACARALERLGPVPTLIERDNDIPAWPVLEAEAALARQRAGVCRASTVDPRAA
ncbi:MAG: DUF692 family protein [Methylibium sp.]|nr:DUF692 family protein [Methylibium sp.]